MRPPIYSSVFSFLLFFGTENIISSQETGLSYFLYQQPKYPKDCKSVRDLCSTQISSGVTLIKPDGYHEPFEAYCDNEVNSGGWTVILRRQDGTIFFQRNWLEYKLGFGFLSQEFWLGNEKLSFLTNQGSYELQVDFTHSDKSSSTVLYTLFRISDELSDYKITSIGRFRNITTCPENTEYKPCTCQKYCATPSVCSVTCLQNEYACICPDGFYINVEDCLPKEDCGCFLEGNIIPEGEHYVTPGCSRRCDCSDGQLVCDDDYHCSPNAVCEERDDLLQCYCNPGYNGDGVTCTSSSTVTDCLDVFNNGNKDSGVYNITPTTWSGPPFEVYCNMSDGGGWTVLQRRVDGSVDFRVYWDDYRNGFGSLESEFWMGNEKMFSLTNQRRYQLQIDFVHASDGPYYAKYDFFRVNNETTNYRLTVENYIEGDAGDSLTVSTHNNQDFSTRDRDNDDNSFYHYSALYGYYNGGWWWGDCSIYYCYSRLNSNYDDGSGIYWITLPKNITFTEMKVRSI